MIGIGFLPDEWYWVLPGSLFLYRPPMNMTMDPVEANRQYQAALEQERRVRETLDYSDIESAEYDTELAYMELDKSLLHHCNWFMDHRAGQEGIVVSGGYVHRRRTVHLRF